MTWKIEWERTAIKEFKKLDNQIQKRISDYLNKIVPDNPRKYGKPLQGDMSLFWSFRVGAYRIISEIVDDKFIIFVVGVGHRSHIYQKSISLSYRDWMVN